MMINEKKSISRKEAIRKLGGLALSLPVGLPLISSMERSHAALESHSPNVITHRKTDKPNILWITAEGVPITMLSNYTRNRWGDLRSRLIETPHINRIAKEGIQFENSFCTNALCAPSRATILTGKYSQLNGVTANITASPSGHPSQNHFNVNQPTFPKILQQNGYQTATIGKWHLQNGEYEPINPSEVGFDKFAFKTGAGGPYYNPDGYLQNLHSNSNKIEHKSHKGYITDVFTEMAVDTMKSFKGDRPFLMFMNFFDDHRPFSPPHKYANLFKGRRIQEPATFWDDYKNRSTAAEEARLRIAYMPDWGAPGIKGRSDQVAPDIPQNMTLRQRQQYNYQKLMEHFLGTLKALDDNVGKLLDYLDQSGLADNTIVYFTSDHGFFLGEHGWFDKRFMYEQALRVPFMARYPGVIKPGSKSDLIGLNIDNAPTVLDMLGLPVPDEMQGRSLRPILEGNPPEDWRKSMYYHYYEFGGNHWVLPNYGIRTERYKLISYYTENQWELFDLQNDPDEMENLFKWDGYDIHPGYEKVVDDLVEELKQLRKKYNDNTGQPVRLVPTKQYD